jgi:hypothetical protein
MRTVEDRTFFPARAVFAGETAVPGNSISGALLAITSHMLNVLSSVHLQRRLVDIRNPRCASDCFTDRWPKDLNAQATYIQDLKIFREQLAAIMNDELSLEEKRNLLSLMFGEGPARAVVEDYAARIGESVCQGNRRIDPTGRVLPAAVAGPTISRLAAAQPRGHTFYGSPWPGR